MFEAITHTTPKVSSGEISSGTTVPIRVPAGDLLQNAPESKKPVEQAEPTGHPVEEQLQEESTQVTPQMLAELELDIETIHNLGLQFSMHNATGRTMIKITDKATEKVIREIPSEDVLNLVAKIEEMIGILFDKKA
jgi:flagellar protein FlaG